MKIILLLLSTTVLVYSSTCFSQDGYFIGHSISFEFVNLNSHNDSLMEINFYINTPYQLNLTTCNAILNKKNLDSLQFELSYGCAVFRPQVQIKCPDIYIELQYQNRSRQGKITEYTILIPVQFEIFNGAFQKVKLEDIDFTQQLNSTQAYPIILVDSVGNYIIEDQTKLEEKPEIKILTKFVEQ